MSERKREGLSDICVWAGIGQRKISDNTKEKGFEIGEEVVA